MTTQTSTTTNEPHPADCDCAKCYEADLAKVRALDAIRYPWAKPERLQWLRDELDGMGLPPFGRSARGRFAASNVLVVLVVQTFDFLPHLPRTVVDEVEAGDEECCAEMLPAGHPTADYLRTPAKNRVLILWGAGMLAAHELPEAEGHMGFKVLVADPAWLDTPAPAAN